MSSFWFIAAFVFLPLDGICTDEQHKNDYNSRSASLILMKLVSIPMFSGMGFLNMQFKFTETNTFYDICVFAPLHCSSNLG